MFKQYFYNTLNVYTVKFLAIKNKNNKKKIIERTI